MRAVRAQFFPEVLAIMPKVETLAMVVHTLPRSAAHTPLAGIGVDVFAITGLRPVNTLLHTPIVAVEPPSAALPVVILTRTKGVRGAVFTIVGVVVGRVTGFGGIGAQKLGRVAESKALPVVVHALAHGVDLAVYTAVGIVVKWVTRSRAGRTGLLAKIGSVVPPPEAEPMCVFAWTECVEIAAMAIIRVAEG